MSEFRYNKSCESFEEVVTADLSVMDVGIPDSLTPHTQHPG